MVIKLTEMRHLCPTCLTCPNCSPLAPLACLLSHMERYIFMWRVVPNMQTNVSMQEGERGKRGKCGKKWQKSVINSYCLIYYLISSSIILYRIAFYYFGAKQMGQVRYLAEIRSRFPSGHETCGRHRPPTVKRILKARNIPCQPKRTHKRKKKYVYIYIIYFIYIYSKNRASS